MLIGFEGAKRRSTTPPLVYATWNPLDKHADITLSGGDLTYTRTSANTVYRSVRGTIGKTTGLHYFEVTYTGAGVGGNEGAGIATSVAFLSTYIGNSAIGASYGGDGNVWNHSLTGGGSGRPTYASGDTIMVAVNLTTGKMWFGKNGTWQGSPSAGTGEEISGISGTVYPAGWLYNNVVITGVANFGASPFLYTVPSGFNNGWHT